MNDPDRLILIGRVAGAFGVRGELRITTYGDDPTTLLAYKHLKREDGRPALTLLSGRPVKGGLVARAGEVADREAADALRGLRLFVPRSTLPPPEEEEFYLADLIGLQVRSPAGGGLGRVAAVQDFGAGNVLEVQPEAGESWMLPFTREAVPKVELTEGWLVAVRPEETE